MGEEPRLVGSLREWQWGEGVLASRVIKGKAADGAKFSDYFEFGQRIKDIPSHRALAMLRGRNDGILDLDLDVAHEPDKPHPAGSKVMVAFGIAERGRPADAWLAETARLAWKTRLAQSIESDLLARLKQRADADAISVFAKNLKDLLLAAPAGPRTTMGLDPGFRTGVKVAVVDQTGKLIDTDTIYPHEPKNDWRGALARLAALCMKHKVQLVSVGNGTASRETDKLVAELIAKMPQLELTKVMVSEAGASVYSASELAAKEFPDLDVTLRGAASIARRLQDPLAELVKIEPKAIGVGQYQHDVDEGGLAKSLDAVVEDCVNSVGVDVNTASMPLLARVSGLNRTLASNIVAFRDENGAFKSRTALKKVPRLGPKAFEQAAGFLRIMNGKNPLDGSAVHPEAYPVVERISQTTGRPLKSIIGDKTFLKSLKPATFADAAFGIPTVTDIIAELEKPGRDPRPEFKTASFKEGVEKLSDLKPGMELEGVVTNVAAFGAFVDVGVHQDGLVHISELSDRFVKDPREIVKAGDVVKVRVKEVDIERKRIALTMKSSALDKSTGSNVRASSPSSGTRNFHASSARCKQRSHGECVRRRAATGAGAQVVRRRYHLWPGSRGDDLAPGPVGHLFGFDMAPGHVGNLTNAQAIPESRREIDPGTGSLLVRRRDRVAEYVGEVITLEWPNVLPLAVTCLAIGAHRNPTVFQRSSARVASLPRNGRRRGFPSPIFGQVIVGKRDIERVFLGREAARLKATAIGRIIHAAVTLQPAPVPGGCQIVDVTIVCAAGLPDPKYCGDPLLPAIRGNRSRHGYCRHETQSGGNRATR